MVPTHILVWYQVDRKDIFRDRRFLCGASSNAVIGNIGMGWGDSGFYGSGVNGIVGYFILIQYVPPYGVPGGGSGVG